MKQVFYKVFGGAKNTLAEASTIGELKKTLGYQEYSAAIDGQNVGDDYEFKDDGEKVLFSPKVKGGAIR